MKNYICVCVCISSMLHPPICPLRVSVYNKLTILTLDITEFPKKVQGKIYCSYLHTHTPR